MSEGLVIGLVIGTLAMLLLQFLKGRRDDSGGSALLAERTRDLKQERETAETLRKDLSTALADVREQQVLAGERQQRLQQVEAVDAERVVSMDRLKAELANAAARNSGLQTQIENQRNDLQELDTLLRETRAALDSLKAEQAETLADNKGKAVQIEALRKQLEEDRAAQKKEYEELRARFNTEFQNIANKVFEEKSARMTQLNSEHIANLLNPLGVSLKEFKEAVGAYNERSSKERTSLEVQVKNLVELNKSLGNEARNLTHALTTDSQKQGRWGEIVLERLLEETGLIKDINYFTQYQLKGPDGTPLKSMADEKMRPDAVVRLPDNHDVIIDAKCSLTAFVRATDECLSDEARSLALKEHILSVKKHVDELSTKAYDDYRQTLNFVLMFIPSEAAYCAAIQGDSCLWQYAYGKRTLIVGPMTLLISLRLIANLWQRDAQVKNVQRIAERGARLYEKFVGFAEVFSALDKKIAELRKSYDDANKKLSTGNGNLVWQAEQLRVLGVNTKKEMPLALSQTEEAGEQLLEQHS